MDDLGERTLGHMHSHKHEIGLPDEYAHIHFHFHHIEESFLMGDDEYQYDHHSPDDHDD